MTDNEIIKALECCSEPVGINCVNCPLEKNCLDVNMCEIALDLINRQKAEIEELKKGIIIELDNFASEYDSQIKAEAVKEFAEKVKAEIKEALESNYKARQERIDKWKNPNAYIGGEFVTMCEGKIAALRGIDYFIDNLLKEMVGDPNA